MKAVHRLVANSREPVNIAVLGSEAAFRAFRDMILGGIDEAERTVYCGAVRLVHITAEPQVCGQTFQGLIRLSESDIPARESDLASVLPVMDNREVIAALNAHGAGGNQ